MQDYEEWVRKRVTRARFEHLEAVRECAVRLAEKHGADPWAAAVAALLHDCARDLPEPELLFLGRKHGLVKDEVEVLVPVLLHGPVGAVLVREELGVTDDEVLRAIANHTLGAPGMGLLEKIIYLADMVSRDRDFPGVGRLRRLAEEDLGAALLEGFASSVRYCLRRRKLIHPQTLAAWNFFLQAKDGGRVCRV